MEAFELEAESSIALLRLHNWVNSPLPVTLFHSASLSPSRSCLTLLSYKQQAVIIPLGPHNARDDTLRTDSSSSPTPSSSPMGSLPISMSSFHMSSLNPLAMDTPPSTPPRSSIPLDSEREPGATPSTGSTVGLQFSSPASQSTPQASPAFIPRRPFGSIHKNPLYEPMPTPYFTPPASTPYFTSPGVSEQTSSSSADAELNQAKVIPHCFQILSEVECFSWACCGDEFAANRSTGPFREILVTVGKEGLVLHAFCVKDNESVNKSASSLDVDPRSTKSRESAVLNGRWCNWGLQNQGKSEITTELMRSEQELEGKGGRGRRKLKFSNEGSTDADNSHFKREKENAERDGGRGFESFVVNGSLLLDSGNLQLQFCKHQPWPASTNCVSFFIAHDSQSFAHLSKFAQGAAWSEQEGIESVPAEPEENLAVVRILSNPSNYLFAVVMAKGVLQQTTADKSSKEDNSMTRSTMRERISTFYVVIARVFSWGVKFVTRLDSGIPEAGNAACTIPWTDFQLSDEVFVALQEDGMIFLWRALSGELITEINVSQFCGLSSELYHTENSCKTKTVDGTRGDNITNALDSEGQHGDAQYHETAKDSTQIAVEESRSQAKEVNAEPSLADASTSVRGNKHRFVQLEVTADCLLIAVTNAQGLVFLVSTDEYFASHSITSTQTSKSNSSSCRSERNDLRVLSSYEVAGLDIGGTKSFSVLGNRKWLNWSSQKENAASSNIDTQLSIKRKLGGQEDRLDLSRASTFEDSTLGASGFTFRSKIVQHGSDVSDPSGTRLQPLRRVFVPVKSSESFLRISLNPYAITRVARSSGREFSLEQKELRVYGNPVDEAQLREKHISSVHKQILHTGDVLTFSSQGCLYIISVTALHVVLPPLATPPPQALGREGPWWLTGSGSEMGASKWDCLLPTDSIRPVIRQWQTEVLDRCLVYDSPEEAERLCVENGWSLQLLRLRRLQLALNYVQFDETEQALEALVHVGAAEVGVLRVLFAAVELILSSYGSDNELVQASRLLALAARFSTRLVRQHGIQQLQQSQMKKTTLPGSPAQFKSKAPEKFKPPSNVDELARFLEVIRTLQDRLQTKRRGPNRGVQGEATSEGLGTAADVGNKLRPIIEFPSESPVQSVIDSDRALPNTLGEQPKALSSFKDMALVPSTAIVTAGATPQGWDVSVGSSEDGTNRRRSSPESAGEMFARWEAEEVNAENVVRDALRAGRVPLAVVQLHRIQSKAFMSGSQDYLPEMVDVFQEVKEIGRGIVYELLCKGKTALAMAALRRLGEDIEVALYELAFGTVRRSLRKQIKAELRRTNTRLGSRDSQLLEITKYLQDLYPSSSFWGTYRGKQLKSANPCVDESASTEEDGLKLQLECDSHVTGTFTLQCGEVDGVVLGAWNSEAPSEALDESGGEQGESMAGYLVLAAAWLHGWDQQTVDRVILDQSFVTGEHTSWGAQLEYYVAHHNWPKVSELLDNIPDSVFFDGDLQIHLEHEEGVEYFPEEREHPDVGEDSADERSPRVQKPTEVIACIPKVHILGINMRPMCSAWLWHMMEVKLVKSHMFLRTHWQGTSELVSLLATADLLFYRVPAKGFSNPRKQQLDAEVALKDSVNRETVKAIHELVVRHCVRYSLVHLLERYLNHHSLALDKESAARMQSIVGNCEWAQWLLLSRLKGREYDASFANARAIAVHNSTSLHNWEISDGFKSMMSVDGGPTMGREIMALATLMYASLPVQKCLSLANRQGLHSWQCSMEDLRPGLQAFPTLWRMLVAACYGHDAWGFVGSLSPKAEITRRLSSYLEWREGLFHSAAGDTSLLQMLPRWLPKNVRRLLQLSIQGPVGGSQAALLPGSNASMKVAMPKAIDGGPVDVNREEAAVLGWEEAVQTTIEEELYAASEEAGMGVEHHLRRGRPLAAFNSFLSTRLHNMGSLHVQSSRYSPPSYEAHNLQSSLTESEEALITPVLPLAITHYENTVVVAACASFLELCGLSAHILQVDVAALGRITNYLKEQEQSEYTSADRAAQGAAFAVELSGVDVTASLCQALADEYRTTGLGILTGKAANRRPCEVLMEILHRLEKASLKYVGTKKVESTAGAWLMNGVGDGTELRAVQRCMSERWSLVTSFCRGHQLPLNTMYLATLARDNDWVGFLAEAQMECCPMDVILEVAAKEFTDIRLQSHILTVLKSLPAAPQKPSTVAGNAFQLLSGLSLPCLLKLRKHNACLKGEALPGFKTGLGGELFALLAECEQRKNPGQALLGKAKDLRWPLLAVVASCFPDVASLSCLTVWLEVTAARETSAIRVNDVYAHIGTSVGSAVAATNAQIEKINRPIIKYNRRHPKRQRHLSADTLSQEELKRDIEVVPIERPLRPTTSTVIGQVAAYGIAQKDQMGLGSMPNVPEEQESLAAMVAVLCEQQRFVPLLRAFELFTPTSSLLPFIRFLQAFAQMRISEASSHLASFSGLLKEEKRKQHNQQIKVLKHDMTWITAAAVTAANAMLEACPTPYERRRLSQLLSAADFGDGGLAAIRFRRYYWKMQLAEPALRTGSDVVTNGTDLDDDALLRELENSGQWEEARSWAGQLDLSSQRTSSALHHVTETQAEAMVTEWKELLWDVREERAALWGHCQALFTRHSYPPLRAGMFFLKHADAVEGELPTSELHGILLLALQWLSGSFNNSSAVYPLHLLHELEIRVWLLAVESEVQAQTGRDQESLLSGRSSPPGVLGTAGLPNSDPILGSPVDRTASAIAVVDSHLKRTNIKSQSETSFEETARSLSRSRNMQTGEVSSPRNGPVAKVKRRTKQLKRTPVESIDGSPSDSDNSRRNTLERHDSIDPRKSLDRRTSLNRLAVKEDQNREGQNVQPEVTSASVEDSKTQTEEGTRGWEERVGEGEVERAVLALVEVGQVPAAKQLQQKLAPAHVPVELLLVDAAQRIAMLSVPAAKGSIVPAFLHVAVLECLRSTDLPDDFSSVTPMQVLKALTMACRDGCGRGLCQRITAVAQVANFLGLSYTEANSKPPSQLLQLLSLKGKEALSEAKLLVATHSMPAASIARILAESFLKGLLAAHRGGYMESSLREEGPAPLLWRPSEFKQWAELCPSEPEVGHALMRLVIGGRDIPHSCEVELIILAHYYYESSACLDGVDVLVSLAATRVESYVAEADFTSLARLVTGVSNFQRLRFILDLLIENGRLELLLQKRAAMEAGMESSVSIRGFRMAVLSALKHFNPYDQDAFMLVYTHFSMAHEMAQLLRSRAHKCVERWVRQYDSEHSEELLEPMRLYVEAAEVYSNMDAGLSTSSCCAQASLISLQLRMPELMWLNLTETNARRLLIEQPRFQEALIVSDAYDLNQSAEWVPVLWNQMLQGGRIDHYLAEFVAALPLPASMLMELARFYRAEVSARGDHLDFSKWLTPGGVPLEHARYLGKSMRSLLKHVRDLLVRVQLATVATGFPDVVDACMQMLDKVPDTAGPLILRKGHGGTYVPLM